jgi:hypothetical protein
MAARTRAIPGSLYPSRSRSRSLCDPAECCCSSTRWLALAHTQEALLSALSAHAEAHGRSVSAAIAAAKPAKARKKLLKAKREAELESEESASEPENAAGKENRMESSNVPRQAAAKPARPTALAEAAAEPTRRAPSR